MGQRGGQTEVLSLGAGQAVAPVTIPNSTGQKRASEDEPSVKDRWQVHVETPDAAERGGEVCRPGVRRPGSATYCVASKSNLFGV